MAKKTLRTTANLDAENYRRVLAQANNEDRSIGKMINVLVGEALDMRERLEARDGKRGKER